MAPDILDLALCLLALVGVSLTLLVVGAPTPQAIPAKVIALPPRGRGRRRG